MTPNWWEFLLLGLAAWSTFHLVAHDDIFDRPRRKLLRLGKEWEKEGDPVPGNYRINTANFLKCPYCAGFWIWIAWLVVWWIWPAGALAAAALMGGRTMVVAGAKLLIKEEDKEASIDALAISSSLREIARKQPRE